jgi:DAK2 domain fusion protein YloV
MAANIFTRLKRPRPKHTSVFNGQDFKAAILAGQVWLERNRAAVDALNVFPVPDGDTGKNMTLTLKAAVKEIAAANDAAAWVIAEKLARGALMGARGNSGVILSQILRGFSEGLGKKETFTATDFAAALQESSRLAYRAVIKPVEGTILTVIREAAAAAQQSAMRTTSITLMLEDTVEAARAAVAKTPDLLPTLKQAGVVDAGGQGLTYILEGILRAARGEPIEAAALEAVEVAIHKGNVEVEEEFGYEVVFLVEGANLDVERIRETIIAMGGVSTVVAGDATLLKVHTHTPTPGKILDYGVGLGNLRDINVENLQEQSLRYAAESKRERAEAVANGAYAAGNGAGNGRAMVAEGPAGTNGTNGTTVSGARAVGAVLAPPPAVETVPQLGDIGTVAVVSGAGWEEVFKSLNVAAIVPGGQTMNPSTEELLAGVERCAHDNVILLPNNGNVILSAQQVPHLTKKQVHVVPSDSMPQGITALLAFNFDADFQTNAHEMGNAIKRVETAEITQAVRTVQIDGINVHEGDIIALVNGRLVTAGSDMRDVVRRALGRMGVEKHEIVTVYYGEGVERGAAEQLAQRIKSWYPNLEIEVMNGGQPYYAYILSAE